MTKNPAHPGGLIRDNIEELGLSVAEAAKGLGVARARARTRASVSIDSR